MGKKEAGMNQIKFSHRYVKMPPKLTPTYIERIEVTHYDNLTPEFIEQDTRTISGSHYELPKEKLIIIWLYTAADAGYKWQTIRRWTEEKEKYYKSLIGQQVSIKIGGAR